MSDQTILTLCGMLIGFFTLWVKLRYAAKDAKAAAINTERVESKVDDNTAVTKAGAIAATTNARAAATAATKAQIAADAVNRKLNGGLDHSILAAINPIKEMIEGHVAQDALDLKEVKDGLDTLAKYAHKHNHAVLDQLNQYCLKLEVLTQGIKGVEN